MNNPEIEIDRKRLLDMIARAEHMRDQAYAQQIRPIDVMIADLYAMLPPEITVSINVQGVLDPASITTLMASMYRAKL